MAQLNGILVLVLGMILLLSGQSCQEKNQQKANQVKVASVFKHHLYYDDIPEDLRKAANSADSTALVNGYVDQWVRKMLLLHEAEQRKPESLDIEKLVEDYKQSLLINNLEKQVIMEELDTVVANNEMQILYETIKDNYIQESPVIRLSYYKIPENTPQIDKFYEWWKNDNLLRMGPFAEKHAAIHLHDPNKWYEWDEIQQIADPEILKRYSFKKPRSIQKNIGEYEYFIKIHEFVESGEISPLGIIEAQVKNMIIQKRKSTVMDTYLERTYLRELKKENILLYNN